MSGMYTMVEECPNCGGDGIYEIDIVYDPEEGHKQHLVCPDCEEDFWIYAHDGVEDEEEEDMEGGV